MRVWYLSGQVSGLCSAKSPRNHCDAKMCTIVPVVHRCGLHFLVLRRFGDHDVETVYNPCYVPFIDRSCTGQRHRGRAQHCCRLLAIGEIQRVVDTLFFKCIAGNVDEICKHPAQARENTGAWGRADGPSGGAERLNSRTLCAIDGFYGTALSLVRSQRVPWCLHIPPVQYTGESLCNTAVAVWCFDRRPTLD